MKVKAFMMAAALALAGAGLLAGGAVSQDPATTLHVEFRSVQTGELIAERDMTSVPEAPDRPFDGGGEVRMPYVVVTLNGRNYQVSSVRWVVGDAGTVVQVRVG